MAAKLYLVEINNSESFGYGASASVSDPSMQLSNAFLDSYYD